MWLVVSLALSAAQTVEQRFPPPPGFTRVEVAPGSFGAFLRTLPLRAPGTPVHLFDGTLKARQDVHAAVVEIDVGSRDLQQCADAVMRLWAEWLWSTDQQHRACFHFTSGDAFSWAQYRGGVRPTVRGARVSWARSAPPNDLRDEVAFRQYLDVIFQYAGSASLARRLRPLTASHEVRPGDVLIQGGSPGHAEVVFDVAVNAAGERIMLLGQSYMPAQDVHLLKGPGPTSPWFPVAVERATITPEWTFPARSARRFTLDAGCW